MHEIQHIGKGIYDQRIGYVYLIAEEDLEYIKIGYSVEPKKRLNSLQGSNPRNVYLLYTIYSKDMSVLEKELHIQFKHLHKKNEWFKYDYSIIERFEELLTKPTELQQKIENSLYINKQSEPEGRYVFMYKELLNKYYLFPDDTILRGKYKGKTIGYIKKYANNYYNQLYRSKLSHLKEYYDLILI